MRGTGTLRHCIRTEIDMFAGTTPVKTAEGQAELSTRARRVSQRHRTVLFLVDGRRSEADIIKLAEQAGVPKSCFDELVEQGFIVRAYPTFSLLIDAPAAEPDVLHIELPIGGDDSSMMPLPAARTLQPDSVSLDSMAGAARAADSWFPSDHAALQRSDPAFAEARLILMREVRAQAPVTGSLTLLKLRRAQSRAELAGLLGEVELRLRKPHRSITVEHTLGRVRQLLGEQTGSRFAPA
jgi:hypothetical protein